jgi:hypothetical protein
MFIETNPDRPNRSHEIRPDYVRNTKQSAFWYWIRRRAPPLAAKSQE